MNIQSIARRTAVGAVALGLAVAAHPSSSTAAGAAGASVKPVRTHYAFFARGFASRVQGGQVPAGSSTTAYQIIGCTTTAGLDRGNNVATATIPGVGTAKDLVTHTSTHHHAGTLSSLTRSSVSRLTLADTPLGSLSLSGIASVARAWHDDSGYHATGHTNIGSITLTPPVGDPQTFPAPAPGTPLDIPGVATITVGPVKTAVFKHRASARVHGLVVDVSGSDSRVVLTAARASIAGNIVSGLFHGQSYGSRLTAADGNVHSGRNPLSVMPCQGTRGNTWVKNLASVDLDPGLVVQGLDSRQRSSQGDHAARGFEQGGVAKLDLGGGQLVVKGVVGRVHVVRTKDGIHRDTQGSTAGSITANGQPMTFPPTGVLEIPGVAKLHRHIVTRYANGIEIVALRIKLLDGSGAVIDLGGAKLRIFKP